MRITPLLVALTALLGSAASAAPQTRVCSKYSTILLNEGESAQVNGAGQFSLSILVNGPRGNWIFYDSLSEPAEADSQGMLVLTDPIRTAYRRSHDARIYAIHPTEPKLIDGKMVKTGAMGVDAMREALDNPAIVGEISDLDVIERVLPGVVDQCDLRFVAGQGLVR